MEKLVLRPGLSPDTPPGAEGGDIWHYLGSGCAWADADGPTLHRHSLAKLFRLPHTEGGGWGAAMAGRPGFVEFAAVEVHHLSWVPRAATREMMEWAVEALLEQEGWTCADDPARPRVFSGRRSA